METHGNYRDLNALDVIWDKGKTILSLKGKDTTLSLNLGKPKLPPFLLWKWKETEALNT